MWQVRATAEVADEVSNLGFLLPYPISPPQPLQRVRQQLWLGRADAVATVEAEDILVVVALFLQHLGHAMIRFYPVVHIVAHDIRVVVIPITDC